MQSAVLNSLNHDIMALYPLRVTPISQNLGPPSAGVSVLGCIHEPIHSILRCSNTLYVLVLNFVFCLFINGHILDIPNFVRTKAVCVENVWIIAKTR
jgi:hypothetical protein